MKKLFSTLVDMSFYKKEILAINATNADAAFLAK